MTEQPFEPVPPADVKVDDDGTIHLNLVGGESVELTQGEAEALGAKLLRAGKIHTYATFDEDGVATWHSTQHPIMVARALFSLGSQLARGNYGMPITTPLADEIQAHLAREAEQGGEPK